MPVDLNQFLTSLCEVGLLTEADAAHWRQAPQKDVREVARELVRQKRITPFQARSAYHGMAKSLAIGSYLVQQRLGGGGMGQVYQAQHRHMKRVVAIKIINKSNLTSQEAIRRFEREVEAVAKLNHPNIVTAHDADVEDGRHYLVMELVEGSDLHSLIRERGPVTPTQAVDWVLQAARGLEYAHQRGIVHRDIKPGNLLLSTANVVKILDMGLARFDDPAIGDETTTDVPLTKMGEIIGTIDFMSPEQAEDTRKADARSDIYSLGCTLYFLLTGEFVFTGDTIMKKLLAHREQPPPNLASRCKDTPPELDKVFRRMVAKQPEQRYQSMSSVIAALQLCRAYLPGKPLTSATIPPLEVTKRPSSSESEELDFDRTVTADGTADSQDLQLAQLPGENEQTARVVGLDTQKTSLPPNELAPRKRPTPPQYPIVVTCACGSLFAAAPNYAGRTAACPNCSQPIVIPSTFPVELLCKCGQRYVATEDVMGRNVICTQCRALMTVPRPKPIEVTCRCGQRFSAIPKLAGKTVRCSSCGAPLTIPAKAT